MRLKLTTPAVQRRCSINWANGPKLNALICSFPFIGFHLVLWWNPSACVAWPSPLTASYTSLIYVRDFSETYAGLILHWKSAKVYKKNKQVTKHRLLQPTIVGLLAIRHLPWSFTPLLYAHLWLLTQSAAVHLLETYPNQHLSSGWRFTSKPTTPHSIACISVQITPIATRRSQCLFSKAVCTGLGPVTSAVTGQHSNQLN